MITHSDKLDTVGYSDFGDVISVELAEAMRKNLDFLRAVCAIGEVAPIMVNIPGVPLPNPNYFQECNGSEITNENSPLRSLGLTQYFTPDMRDRYIYITKIGGQNAGTQGGANTTYDFKHNHGGYTGSVGTNHSSRHSNESREAAFTHNHTIAFSHADPINMEPPFYTVKFYMRIQ
jgi:hypothetical protein